MVYVPTYWISVILYTSKTRFVPFATTAGVSGVVPVGINLNKVDSQPKPTQSICPVTLVQAVIAIIAWFR